MAQKVTVKLVDDLDGSASKDVTTVTFSLDGIEYEIDLSEPNANTLRSTLDPFIGPARRTGGRIKRGGPRSTHSTADQERTRAIRAWANENGYDLAERGRIPNHVIEAYDKAQAQPAKPKAKRARRKVAAG